MCADSDVTVGPADDPASPIPVTDPVGTVEPVTGAGDPAPTNTGNPVGHPTGAMKSTASTGNLAGTVEPTADLDDPARTAEPTADISNPAGTIEPAADISNPGRTIEPTADTGGTVESAIGGRSGSGVTQPLRVTLSKAPRAVTLMLATEILRLRRIVSTRGPVTHCGQLPGAEQLSLPHI